LQLETLQLETLQRKPYSLKLCRLMLQPETLHPDLYTFYSYSIRWSKPR
jgi:hypothetical protein